MKKKKTELTMDMRDLPVFPSIEMMVVFESGFIFSCKIFPGQTHIKHFLKI